jgi:DNA polymerase III alpha subunit
MKKKKIFRVILIVFLISLAGGGGYAYYLWNMPQRNVQETPVDFKLNASQLVEEYLNDAKTANQKYLSDDGDSKVLAITGTVNKIDDDMNKQKVVLLKTESDKAGVSCTFTSATNSHAQNLKAGDIVTIKGVIRSGASYDSDLEMYENVIIEKCDLIHQ